MLSSMEVILSYLFNILLQTLLIDKARLEKDLEIANDKLSVALSDCKTKDELVKKLTNMEQEAIASNSLFFL